MKLTSKARNSLPTSTFADPDDRKFPLPDKSHVRSALSYIRYANPQTATKIRSKAKAMGIGMKAPKRIKGK